MSATTYDLDLKLTEFKINGFAVFEDLLDLGLIERMAAGFAPVLEAHRANDDERTPTTARTGDGPAQNLNRYNTVVPWRQPFADPAVFEHPVVLEFLERYWESDDFVIAAYGSNTPYPDSIYQRWHRDIRPHPGVIGQPTTPVVGMKFPLVDTEEQNGSFEVLPGTQYISDPELFPRRFSDDEHELDDLLEVGDFPAKQRLNLRRGTLWIQDGRTLHRGTPNLTDRPRPELSLAYRQSWYNLDPPVETTSDEFDRLSERGQRLMRQCRIVDAV